MILFDFLIDKLYGILEFYDSNIAPIAKSLGEVILGFSLFFLILEALLWNGWGEVGTAFLLIIGGLLYKLGLMEEAKPRQAPPL